MLVFVFVVKWVLAAKTIKATPAMAPAHGLYLAEVKYDFSEFRTRENMRNEDDGDVCS
jgi:tRNA U38,U39,U40 pseudouridine synthase TruA